MSGICDTCQRNQNCRRPMDGMDSCRLYVSGKESRYEKLFGTPERAAKTIADNCKYLSHCGSCPIPVGNCDGEESTVLEWLKGES